MRNNTSLHLVLARLPLHVMWRKKTEFFWQAAVSHFVSAEHSCCTHYSLITSPQCLRVKRSFSLHTCGIARGYRLTAFNSQAAGCVVITVRQHEFSLMLFFNYIFFLSSQPFTYVLTYSRGYVATFLIDITWFYGKTELHNLCKYNLIFCFKNVMNLAVWGVWQKSEDDKLCQ